MNFGEALEHLKQGKSARMSNWKDDWLIRLYKPVIGYGDMTESYIYLDMKYKTIPWYPAYTEMLSENWELV